MTQAKQSLDQILQENLLSKTFLEHTAIPESLLQEFVNDQQMRSELMHFTRKAQWTCEDLMEFCCRYQPEWYETVPEQGWLSYCYAYMISLSYPDSVAETFANQFQCGVEFFLQLLRTLLDYDRQWKPFDPFVHFALLSPSELETNVLGEEYQRFLSYFRATYLYELMYVGKELSYYNILSHIAGVHYVAMHMARQLQQAGVPINLALVSGAAIGHDIGKFGCKASEVKRMAHLHYYYTDLWFKQKNMPGIAHIAVNHSTWDLELENLPLESLLLIYADFRVRREECAAPKEKMGIFTLQDAFHIILSKLENVDAAKEKRYHYVYAKLKDFENYMVHLGVNTDFSTTELTPLAHTDIVLIHGEEVVEAFKQLAVKHNIWLMDTLNTESSFVTLLEAARSEKDWKNTRAYIHIFEEYDTYMTQKQKVLTLNFLYELLMHREGDIRRQAADLMGIIILHYDENYRKELPFGVILPNDKITGLGLWRKYLKQIILPDHKVTSQHKRWIGFALKNVVNMVLNKSNEEERPLYLDILMDYYSTDNYWEDAEAFVLLDTLIAVPFIYCEQQQIAQLLYFAQDLFQRNNLELQACVLQFLDALTGQLALFADSKRQIKGMLDAIPPYTPLGMQFLCRKIGCRIGLEYSQAVPLVEELTEEHNAISEIFLENLKVATPWVLKLINIDFLLEIVTNTGNISVLQVATHLSNLLKVSERVTVRHKAGQGLVAIAPLLTLEQRNEMVIELTKGLEIGEYEFSKYIPEYLGQVALYLHPEELDELLHELQPLLYHANRRVAAVTLNTLGVILEYYPGYRKRFAEEADTYHLRRRNLLGLILAGLANYDEEISQEAFLVLGHRLFGSLRLTMQDKYDIFYLVYKRMLVLIYDKPMAGLSFLNRAGALNHIYRFISDYLYEEKHFVLPETNRVAFFPGTFDPFSSGHKGIVQAIRNLGYQVYLALDEFSWSKKTQPRMTRRQIITMSIADEENVFLFPDDIPVNISNTGDLARLSALFANKELYMVVGSDVILNASAYRNPPAAGSIHHFHHIIFKRISQAEASQAVEETEVSTEGLCGDVILLELPTHLEDVSSSRIRENIDSNRDISNLISPIAQNYIYRYGLYLREPQYKTILQAKNIHFTMVNDRNHTAIDKMINSFAKSAHWKPYDVQESSIIENMNLHWSHQGAQVLLLQDANFDDSAVAMLTMHSLESTDLYEEFGDAVVVESLRKKTFGRIAVISGIYVAEQLQIKNAAQLLLTEALAHYLAQDYGYAIYHGEQQPMMREVLLRQGFVAVPIKDTCKVLYVVDMREPVTLMKNIETTIKEPLNRNERVLSVVEECHQRLQQAMTELYPGKLILSFDAGIMHHKMLKRITSANQVPSEPLPVRKLGERMCVPFGKVLRGMVVPNTVTKTLHTEKVYSGDMKQFRVTNFPFYSSLENQMRTIKSFNRPVILVDDLLHKGYRIQELAYYLELEKVPVDRMVVGILSAKGRDLMNIRQWPVDSVYFIPRIKAWYVESTLYPFIGGDMVERQERADANLIPSINLILPYVVPSYMHDVSREALYHFSLVCLENVREILKVLEEEYQNVFERRLTLGRLSEIIISPRCPDRGSCMTYDKNIAASVYVEDDIERLQRLQSIVKL